MIPLVIKLFSTTALLGELLVAVISLQSLQAKDLPAVAQLVTLH
jgi:hypothetical protein